MAAASIQIGKAPDVEIAPLASTRAIESSSNQRAMFAAASRERNLQIIPHDGPGGVARERQAIEPVQVFRSLRARLSRVNRLDQLRRPRRISARPSRSTFALDLIRSIASPVGSESDRTMSPATGVGIASPDQEERLPDPQPRGRIAVELLLDERRQGPAVAIGGAVSDPRVGRTIQPVALEGVFIKRDEADARGQSAGNALDLHRVGCRQRHDLAGDLTDADRPRLLFSSGPGLVIRAIESLDVFALENRRAEIVMPGESATIGAGRLAV